MLHTELRGQPARVLCTVEIISCTWSFRAVLCPH